MSQDFIPAAKPIIGDEERAAVDRVLRSGMLAQGPEVAAFEQEFSQRFVDGRACVAVNSGTSGLHLGLLAAGIGPGDEVIVPSFTFAATANSVALTGATPVFADIEPDHFCLDPAAVAAAVTPRTKAIMPVHLYGHPADMDALGALAAEHGLQLFEDAAQAHGATLRRHARWAPSATFAMFSLYPTKNMTSGEGGMVSRRPTTVERQLRLLRNQGMEQQYENEVVGFNARMTDLHAAIGRVQLTKVGGWTAQRQAERGVPGRQPGRRRHPAGRRRRGPRLPPVHRAGGRGTGTASPRRCRTSTTSAPASTTRSRTTGCRPSTSTSDLPETEAAARRGALAAGAPLADAEDDLDRIVTAVNALAKAGA